MNDEHDVLQVMRGLSEPAAQQFREGCEDIGQFPMACAIVQLVHQSSIADTIDLLDAIAEGRMQDLMPGDGALKDPLL